MHAELPSHPPYRRGWRVGFDARPRLGRGRKRARTGKAGPNGMPPPSPQTSHLHRLPVARYLRHLEAASRYAAFESHILVTGTVWGLATTTAKFGEVPGGKATMDAMTFVDGNAELIADMHLRHLFVHTRPLCEKSMQSSARRSSHVVSIYVYFMSKQFLLTGRGLSKIGANGMTAGKKLQFCHWCWMSACQSADSSVVSSQGSCPFRPAASCTQNLTLQKKNRRSSNVVSSLGQDVHLCGPTSDIISSNLTEKPTLSHFCRRIIEHMTEIRQLAKQKSDRPHKNGRLPSRRKHVLSLTDVKKMLLGSYSKFLTSTMQTVRPISMSKSKNLTWSAEVPLEATGCIPSIKVRLRSSSSSQSACATVRLNEQEDVEIQNLNVDIFLFISILRYFFRPSSCNPLFVSGAAQLVCHAGAPLRHFCIIRFHIDRLAGIGLDWKLVCLQHMAISVATSSKPRHPVFHCCLSSQM